MREYACLDADDIPQDLTKRIAQARQDLDLESVDYEATMKTKMSIAREFFDRKDHELLQVCTYGGYTIQGICPIRSAELATVAAVIIGTLEWP